MKQKWAAYWIHMRNIGLPLPLAKNTGDSTNQLEVSYPIHCHFSIAKWLETLHKWISLLLSYCTTAFCNSTTFFDVVLCGVWWQAPLKKQYLIGVSHTARSVLLNIYGFTRVQWCQIGTTSTLYVCSTSLQLTMPLRVVYLMEVWPKVTSLEGWVLGDGRWAKPTLGRSY